MEPLPAPPGSARAARRILLLAAVAHLFFFVTESRGQLAGLFAGRAEATGPLVRGYDGHGYYAWLRSLLIDGDWQFGNDFDHFRTSQPTRDPDLGHTPTGRVMNQWSVGPAVLWSATVVPVHMILGVTGGFPRDGFSPPYQLAVGAGTFAAGLLTLLLFYAIARRFAEPVAAACAASAMTLGTPVVAYSTADVAMAHGPATTALAACVLVWLRGFGSLDVRRWAAVGFLLGLAALCRWQLVTFAVLPALEAAWLWRGRAVACLCAAGGAAAVGFLPQMVAWRVVYGSPLVQPHNPTKNWLDPAVLEVLFTTDRGFFYWTPLTLVAAAGLWFSPLPRRFIGGEGKRSAGEGGDTAGGRSAPSPAALRGDLSPIKAWGRGDFNKRRATAAVLAVAAAGQVYMLAVVYMYGPPVSLGGSFGFRYLCETCVVLVPGAALLLRPRAAGLVAGGLVGWNLLLLGVHRYGIDGFHAGGPAALLHAAGRYAQLRPLDAAVVLLLSCSSAVFMSTRRTPQVANSPQVRIFHRLAVWRLVGTPVARPPRQTSPHVREECR